jgi:hypothetical protein
VWSITYENNENAPQVARKDDYTANIVTYEDLIYFKHNKTECMLSINEFYKAPRSGKAEGKQVFIIFKKFKLIIQTIFLLQCMVIVLLLLICVALRSVDQPIRHHI